MLYLIGQALETFFGPFRLLTSGLFLIVAGTALGFIGTFLLLPRSYGFLPSDRGKSFAVASSAAKGKPTGAGIVFVHFEGIGHF